MALWVSDIYSIFYFTLSRAIVQSSSSKSYGVATVRFDNRRIDAEHVAWAKTPSGSDRSTAAVSSTSCHTCPSSQIRPSVELRIENQA